MIDGSVGDQYDAHTNGVGRHEVPDLLDVRGIARVEQARSLLVPGGRHQAVLLVEVVRRAEAVRRDQVHPLDVVALDRLVELGRERVERLHGRLVLAGRLQLLHLPRLERALGLAAALRRGLRGAAPDVLLGDEDGLARLYAGFVQRAVLARLELRRVGPPRVVVDEVVDGVAVVRASARQISSSSLSASGRSGLPRSV